MIFVDDVFVPRAVRWRGGWVRARWCHLLTDQDDPAELHTFAARIGMPRAWFQPGRNPATGQPDPTRDHYDLTEQRRHAAIGEGATAITARDAARMRIRRRAESANRRPETR